MKMGLSKAKTPAKIDFLLLLLLLLMATASLLSIYSTFGLTGADGLGYLIRQVMWYVIGFIAIAFMVYLGNDSIMDFAKIAYWILMVCLVALLIGQIYYRLTGATLFLKLIATRNGATSWFEFPSPLGQFQPSEFMKIVLIIITAGIIDKHNKNKTTESYEMDFSLFLEVAKRALPPIILILLQPDTGVVIIIVLSLLAMIICSGIKREWLIILGVTITVALLLFFYMYYFHFDVLNNMIGGTNGYKLKRITSWLNPESDISGDGMQLYTSLMVMGSAGLTGHGAGMSLVAIPEAHTDFIYAIVGQSWGLIGCLVILFLCLMLDIYLCRIAANCKNMFEKYLICGILGMLLYQQIQNIGMIVGLIPITGITLPLISYGGSSMLSYMVAFGIIMNASAKNKANEFS